MSKKSLGRRSMGKAKKVVMVSGGFDPVHIGHVRMFEEAKKLGDELVVLLNNDNWLKLKKGYVFMPENERKEIIEAFKAVNRVILTSHEENTEDISISKDLLAIRPHIFTNIVDYFTTYLFTNQNLWSWDIANMPISSFGKNMRTNG